jgi:7 transmembrane receptor (rhodopsin family)
MNATLECGDCNTSFLPSINSTLTDGPQRALVQFVVIAILSASVAVGNILLIATVCRSRNLRTSVSNAFILNLAVVDLTSAIFVLPMFAATVIVRLPPGGASTCTAVGFITQTLLVESIITLGLIGVDRYVNICHPLRYLQLVTKQTAIIVICKYIYFSFDLHLPVFCC